MLKRTAFLLAAPRAARLSFDGGVQFESGAG